MKNRFLAVDVGSSYLKFGLFEENGLLSVERVEKERIQEFFQQKPAEWKGVESAVSSVSPSLVHLLDRELLEQTGFQPYFLNYQDVSELTLSVKEPETVGVDRILNCLAAQTRYRQNVIILDLGTATTIDVVTDDNTFIGGMILPGIDTFKNALFENTEQLSPHRSKILSQSTLPGSYLGKNTFEAINAGVVGGYYVMIKGLLKELQEELIGEYRIIATGGGVTRLNIEPLVSEIRPDLSLEGIKIAYERVKRI